jgi:ParB family chromosome partitioning protein
VITSNEKAQKTALGRGLSALIPQAGAVPISGALTDRNIVRLPIESIHRDRNQPRKVFDEEKLRELADSIRSQGLIQPVLVRRDGTGYRLIAGERRWRAAQLAGLQEIPGIVREATDVEAFEIALVENLQRADLNPIEEAEGYRRLMSDYALTQEAVSERVGKDRSTIANSLRLLGLPEAVKAMLSSAALSMGHARALLGLPEPDEITELAKKVVAQRLSVRDVERLVKRKKEKAVPRGVTQSAPSNENLHARQLVEELQRALGTRVRLNDRGGKGSLEIEFFSYSDLDRLAVRLRS